MTTEAIKGQEYNAQTKLADAALAHEEIEAKRSIGIRNTIAAFVASLGTAGLGSALEVAAIDINNTSVNPTLLGIGEGLATIGGIGMLASVVIGLMYGHHLKKQDRRVAGFYG